MPFFLSSQFKEIIDERDKDKEEENEANDKKHKQAGGGLYKSEFLHRKINEQNEKKKAERQALKANRKAGNEAPKTE